MNCKRQRIEILLSLSLSLGGWPWSLVGLSFCRVSGKRKAGRADNHAHVVTPKAPCFISISPCLPPAPEQLEIAFGICAGVCACQRLHVYVCVRLQKQQRLQGFQPKREVMFHTVGWSAEEERAAWRWKREKQQSKT